MMMRTCLVKAAPPFRALHYLEADIPDERMRCSKTEPAFYKKNKQTKDEDMEWQRLDKIMGLTPVEVVKKTIIKTQLDTLVINNCFTFQL